MSQRATGSFDVKVVPQKPDTQIARAANLSRLTIDKRFHGDLEGISKGEMLAMQSDVKGSAGYVALERITGKLKGKQRQLRPAAQRHHDARRAGLAASTWYRTPAAASSQASAGKMSDQVNADGAHAYEFDFKLEADA